MKTTSLCLLTSLTAVLGIGNVLSEPLDRKASPMRDVVTHNQLSQSLRMVQQKDPIRDLGPAAGKSEVDPSLQNSSRDLIKESTILCYRGFLTLVPKRAVIHQPEKLKARFEVENGAKVQNWAEFFQANRGWIRTLEVSREQAMGQAPLAEAIVETFKTSPYAVVATFKGGPISVLPYKEPEVDAAAGADTLTPEPTEEKP